MRQMKETFISGDETAEWRLTRDTHMLLHSSQRRTRKHTSSWCFSGSPWKTIEVSGGARRAWKEKETSDMCGKAGDKRRWFDRERRWVHTSACECVSVSKPSHIFSLNLGSCPHVPGYFYKNSFFFAAWPFIWTQSTLPLHWGQEVSDGISCFLLSSYSSVRFMSYSAPLTWLVAISSKVLILLFFRSLLGQCVLMLSNIMLFAIEFLCYNAKLYHHLLVWLTLVKAWQPGYVHAYFGAYRDFYFFSEQEAEEMLF